MFTRPGAVAVCLAFLTISAPLAAQQAERRWIVDNSAASSGDGSPASPFLTLAEAVKAAGEGDVIVLSATDKPYAGGIALRGGHTLIGEGGTPLITASEGDVVAISGTSAVTIANVRVQATGTANGITIRNTTDVVTLRDVAVSTAGGTGVLAAKTKKLAIAATTVDSTDAPAISVEGAELDAVFRGISARGTRLASGIVLQNTTGRMTVEGGTIEGATKRAVNADGASNLIFRAMHIVRSASASDVRAFDCGGDLLTSSNERCNAAVYLRNVDGVLLEGMTIEGSGQSGIVAHDVNALQIVDTTIRNAGNELFEHGLVLEELSGDCRIAGTTVEKSASRHLMLHNSRDRLSLTIERSKFVDTGKPHGQQGVLVTAVGDAAIDLRVRDSLFARALSTGLEVTGTDNAKLAVRVTGSTFDRSGSAINLAITQAARLDYVIADNPSLTVTDGSAINVYVGSPSTGLLSGSIVRNVIGTSGIAGSGAGCPSCSGIVLSATGQGDLIADVSGNVVQQVGASAIHASATQGGSRLHLTATSNLLREGSATAPAIRVQSGALVDDTTRVCADIGGSAAKANKIEGATEPNGAIHLIHRFGGSRLQLVGLTEGKSDVAAAAAVAARNGDVKVRAVLRPDSMEKGFEPAERCTMPDLRL